VVIEKDPHDESRPKAIYDEWGFNRESHCGNSGVLVYMTAKDEEITIARGVALEAALPDSGLQNIIQEMNRQILQGLSYGSILQFAVEEIAHRFEERNLQLDRYYTVLRAFLFLMPVVLAALLVTYRMKYSSDSNRLKKALRQLDAIAIARQRKAISCPHCFGSFIDIPPESMPLISSIARFGHDGRPIKLLPCGHVFDSSCWRRIVREQDQLEECPICSISEREMNSQIRALMNPGSRRRPKRIRDNKIVRRLSTVSEETDEEKTFSAKSCPVCLEDFVEVSKDDSESFVSQPTTLLPCGHSLHQACWDQMAQNITSCPVCRRSTMSGEAGFSFLTGDRVDEETFRRERQYRLLRLHSMFPIQDLDATVLTAWFRPDFHGSMYHDYCEYEKGLKPDEIDSNSAVV
jgi:hypothetical protein